MFYQYNDLKNFPKIINRNVFQFFLVISEALERLQLKDHRLEVSNDPELYSDKTLGKCQSIVKEYEHFWNRVKKGEFGKRAQFWVLYFKNQYFADVAAQSNNFDLRLFAWKYMIPFFFVLNKINYARYGSFYTESMGNIEKFYPNLKPLLETKGLLVQRQEHYA